MNEKEDIIVEIVRLARQHGMSLTHAEQFEDLLSTATSDELEKALAEIKILHKAMDRKEH